MRHSQNISVRRAVEGTRRQWFRGLQEPLKLKILPMKPFLGCRAHRPCSSIGLPSLSSLSECILQGEPPLVVSMLIASDVSQGWKVGTPVQGVLLDLTERRGTSKGDMRNVGV